jgi:hypothetical protein
MKKIVTGKARVLAFGFSVAVEVVGANTALMDLAPDHSRRKGACFAC